MLQMDVSGEEFRIGPYCTGSRCSNRIRGHEPHVAGVCELWHGAKSQTGRILLQKSGVLLHTCEYTLISSGCNCLFILIDKMHKSF